MSLTPATTFVPDWRILFSLFVLLSLSRVFFNVWICFLYRIIHLDMFEKKTVWTILCVCERAGGLVGPRGSRSGCTREKQC